MELAILEGERNFSLYICNFGGNMGIKKILNNCQGSLIKEPLQNPENVALGAQEF